MTVTLSREKTMNAFPLLLLIEPSKPLLNGKFFVQKKYQKFFELAHVVFYKMMKKLATCSTTAKRLGGSVSSETIQKMLFSQQSRFESKTHVFKIDKVRGGFFEGFVVG